MFDLTGRTALVAGASSGLGEGFARLLSKAGAKVVLGARRTAMVDRIAGEIVDGGGKAMAVPLAWLAAAMVTVCWVVIVAGAV